MEGNGDKNIFKNLGTLREVVLFPGKTGRYCSIRLDFICEPTVPFATGSFE